MRFGSAHEKKVLGPKNAATLKPMVMNLCNLAPISALLALAIHAQENPIRILPVPAPRPDIAVEPAPPPLPIGLPPGVDIKGPEDWAEPGFPGEMIMTDMPGRFKILTVQIYLNGKATPAVLKLDTMTGQTWQLKLSEQKFLFNGKAHVRTQLAFELVAQGQAPVRELRDHTVGRNIKSGVLPGRGGLPDIPAPQRIGDDAPARAIGTEPSPTIPKQPQRPRRFRAPRREP